VDGLRFVPVAGSNAAPRTGRGIAAHHLAQLCAYFRDAAAGAVSLQFATGDRPRRAGNAGHRLMGRLRLSPAQRPVDAADDLPLSRRTPDAGHGALAGTLSTLHLAGVEEHLRRFTRAGVYRIESFICIVVLLGLSTYSGGGL